MTAPAPDGTPWPTIIVLGLIGLLVVIAIVREALGHTPPARRRRESGVWPFGESDGGDGGD